MLSRIIHILSVCLVILSLFGGNSFRAYSQDISGNIINAFDSVYMVDTNKAQKLIAEFDEKIELISKNKIKDSLRGINFLLKAKYLKFYKKDFDLGVKYFDSALHYFRKIKDTNYTLITSISYAGMYSDYDKIANIVLEVEPMSLVFNDSVIIYKTYGHLARAEYIRGNILTSFEHFKKGERYVKTETQYKETNIYHDASLIYKRLGLNSYALKYLNKYLELQLKEDDQCGIYNAYSLIAKNYQSAKKYEKSLDYLSKIDDKVYCGAYTLNYKLDLARTYVGLGMLDSAKKCLRNFKIADGVAGEIAKVNINQIYGQIYINDQEYDSAISLFGSLIRSYEEGGRKHLTGHLHHRIAICYEKKGMLSNAIKHAETASSLVRNIKKDKLFLKINKYLATLYKKNGNYLKAIIRIEQNDSVRASINELETAILIKEGEYALENQLLENDKRNLIKDNALKESELNQSRNRLFYRGFILFALVILLVVLFFMFRSYRKQKAKEKSILLKEIEVNREEIILLHEQLENRKKLVAETRSNLTKESVLEKLRSSDDWIELFVCTESLYDIKFNEVSKVFSSITKKDLKTIALTFYKLSNKEIANILFITESGVKKRKQRIRAKLGVSLGEDIDDFLLSKTHS